MAGKENMPVLIKKRRIVKGEGHHGGAWKVAYADFVTAMMAFFLLMWLLNATSEKQRQGIAHYFNPEVPLYNLGGGRDSLMGEQNESTAVSAAPVTVSEHGQAEETALESLEAKLRAVGGESAEAMQLLKHVVSRISDEGIVIEVSDLPDSALFQGDTAEPTETLTKLIQALHPVLAPLPDMIGINGFIRSHPITMRNSPIWPLSAERAQSVRKLLEDIRIDPQRIQRVVGHADRQPKESNPMAVGNNRIEIVLLKKVTRW